MRLRTGMHPTGVDRMDTGLTGTDQMDTERKGVHSMGRGCERRSGAGDCAES